MEAITVETRGLTFTGFTGGPSTGSPVLLMHGFPQLASAWRPVAERLVAVGCRIVALDARGYSPGARPSSIDDYAMGHLVDDVVGWLDALGWERCDLVGHDFGAAVGWHVAAHHPERVRTWSALSVPHQGAFLAVRDRDPDQARKSGYMTMFREDPDGVAESFLADGGARMAKMYGGDVPDEQVREYIRRHSEPRAFLSALYWYCAMGREPLPAMRPIPTSVPVQVLWGSDDVATNRATIDAAADWVEGDHRLVVLDGRGHWLPEQCPHEVADHLLDWWSTHP